MNGSSSIEGGMGISMLPHGAPWPLWLAPTARAPQPGPTRWVVPPSRPRLSRSKPVATAHTMMVRLPGDQLLLSVEHETLARITPPMLSAWFRGLPRALWHAGREYTRHALWHPVDHVHWSLLRPAPRGGMGVGARVHEVVACGGRAEHLVEVVADVERLDEHGVTLVRRWLGVEVMRLQHSFRAVDDGTEVHTRLWVGVAGGGWRERWAQRVNLALRPVLLPDATALAWLHHCVEQVGMLQGLLPRLSRR
ncbi:MAG: hypothetical protein JNN18_23615 [Rubrivivax sp.]|nr:hypothetical protein [Rubrivivax sp.]